MEINCVHFSVHLVTRSYISLDLNLQKLNLQYWQNLASVKRIVRWIKYRLVLQIVLNWQNDNYGWKPLNQCYFLTKLGHTWVILETEGSVQKIQKRACIHYKQVTKGTCNLNSPYVHSLFTIVLVKHIFEKNKSLRAVSGSQTQFQPKTTSGILEKTWNYSSASPNNWIKIW